MENERTERPENWGSISIDEMNPVFNHEDGTVTITSEHFSKAMRVGSSLTVASNEFPERIAEGEVIEVDPDNQKIKIKLHD